MFSVSAPIHCFWENASGSSNFEEERVGIMSSRQVNVVVAAHTILKAGEYPSVRSISLMKMLSKGVLGGQKLEVSIFYVIIDQL